MRLTVIVGTAATAAVMALWSAPAQVTPVTPVAQASVAVRTAADDDAGTGAGCATDPATGTSAQSPTGAIRSPHSAPICGMHWSGGIYSSKKLCTSSGYADKNAGAARGSRCEKRDDGQYDLYEKR